MWSTAFLALEPLKKRRCYLTKYTCHRDKLFIIGSEDVLKGILHYENEAAREESELYDKYLTDTIKSIRKDLKIKNYPKFI